VVAVFIQVGGYVSYPALCGCVVQWRSFGSVNGGGHAASVYHAPVAGPGVQSLLRLSGWSLSGLVVSAVVGRTRVSAEQREPGIDALVSFSR
jgi:hypothetical protein